MSCMAASQKTVTGEVRLCLLKGQRHRRRPLCPGGAFSIFQASRV